MHTAIATDAGLLLLGGVLALGRLFGLGPRTTAPIFVGLWFIASLVHGALGLTAGQTLATEAAVWLVVFGLPVAVLTVLDKKL